MRVIPDIPLWCWDALLQSDTLWYYPTSLILAGDVMLRFAWLLLTLLFVTPGANAQALYIYDRDYAAIHPQVKKYANPSFEGSDPAVVEVVALFSLGCNMCKDVLGPLEDWIARQPSRVRVTYLPVLRSQDPAALPTQFAAAYFLAETKGLMTPQFRRQLFDWVYVKNQEQFTVENMYKLYATLKISSQDVKEAMETQDLRIRLQHARELFESYHADSANVLVVAGKYRVDLLPEDTQLHTALPIVDFLVSQADLEYPSLR